MKTKINGKKATANDELLMYLDKLFIAGDSVLDLGCGPKLYSSPFQDRLSSILTVDAWENVQPDVVADLETTSLYDILQDRTFDYILMLDFIEHLSKDSGLRLLEEAKEKANKQILLLTPLEEIWDDNHKNVNNPKLWCYGNTYDLHKSMWDQLDFTDWTKLNLPGLEKYYVGFYSCEN